jgi:hypothetical protein
MVIALAGRRIDATDAKTTRFPLYNIDKVKVKMKELFVSIQPAALVCSGACGADLLALEIAGELGISRHIVLPFDGTMFKSKSVTDRPGNWGNLFDNIYREVQKKKQVLTLNYPGNDDNSYRQTNIEILNRAKYLAEKLDSKNIIGVIVWEGSSKNKNDITGHFKEEAESRGFIIKEINTLNTYNYDKPSATS